MELKGKIKVINPTMQVSEKFAKRDCVVTTEDGLYPQDILVQFTQDKIFLLDSVKVGQEVIISINLKGREWTDKEGKVKYFNTIEGWKIAGVENGYKAPVAQTKNVAVAPVEEEGDLPFLV